MTSIDQQCFNSAFFMLEVNMTGKDGLHVVFLNPCGVDFSLFENTLESFGCAIPQIHPLNTTLPYCITRSRLFATRLDIHARIPTSLHPSVL